MEHRPSTDSHDTDRLHLGFLGLSSHTLREHISWLVSLETADGEVTSLSEDAKLLTCKSKPDVSIRCEDGVFRKSSIWVERNNFYEVFNPRFVSEYLIVGFDTEYKSPSEPLTKTQIDEGLGKYQVLSYQFHCILFDPTQPEAREWKGICYPVDGERLKLPDFLTFALADGISSGAIHKIPVRIYLAGHFTKADVPAFADFKSLADIVSSIRNTFISTKPAIPVTIEFPDEGPEVSLNVVLRDTILLTPTNAKSLKAIGGLVGVDKIELGNSPAEDLHLKKNMDILLATNPAEFEQYAITDATICAKYVKRIIDQYETLLGKHKLPPTLTSMGVVT